ncbi:MAG: 30S ribosomal protein S2 [Actinobacteria bacterium RBG_16_64_13]|nr:MAG: 30S ribosomal protein S2 [Actinobacteria bacterium RBG_16_64_13]
MPAASMKQLLESGVHFGHQTRRWNPKMKPYIFTERGGIHIIDLQQTTDLLDRAYDFVRNIASRGGTVLFVGTKKQCQDIVRDEAGRVGMPYVSHRWLGGLLTNFSTIENRIKRMHDLRKLKEEGQLTLLPTKERMAMERELEKLEINLGGVSIMTRLPDAVFVADPKREAIATKEVTKLGLPLIGLCDTNCDPDEVDYVIPGNDDAIRSCGLIVRTLARAVEEGRQKVQVSEFLAAEAARASAMQSQAMPYSSGEPGEAGGSDPRSRGPRGVRTPDGQSRGQGRPGPGGRPSSGGRPTAGGRPGGGDRQGGWQGSREGAARPAGAEQPAPARRVPAARAAAAPRKKEAAPEATAATEVEKAPVSDTAIPEEATLSAAAPQEAPEAAPVETAPVEASAESAVAEAAPEADAEA